MTNKPHKHVTEANQILMSLGLPRAQQNERSALCLLALLNLTPRKKWARAETLLMGITPIMDWAREHYQKEYAPNTRETFRRQTMHQFVDAGIARYNPDRPDRPVNSPKAVYQIEPATVELLRSFGTKAWHEKLPDYLSRRETLVARYAKERKQNRIPVQIAKSKKITLSPGEHSKLIRAIIEEFGPRFVPGSVLVYAGDTGDKWGYFDAPLLANLCIKVDSHGKMPDVVLYHADRNWLVLIAGRYQSRTRRRQTTRRVGSLICRGKSRASLCDGFPEPCRYGPIPWRYCVGNRSMGRQGAIAPNPLRWRALPGTI